MVSSVDGFAGPLDMPQIHLNRPPVSDLMFHLYDKPVHPELFETLAERRVRHADYMLTVRITRDGHAISWDHPTGHLTEIAAGVDCPLPTYRGLFRHKLRGERADSIAWVPGFTYSTTFSVEELAEEQFRYVHEEITRDSLKRGVCHQFRPHNRLELSPLGFVTSDAWAGNLIVYTYHTYPDERTVVKTQSLIERRGG